MTQVKAQVRLKARYLPYLIGTIILLQLFFPNRSWTIFLVGFGGALLVANRWAYSLASGLKLTRERRYGWAQVGDQLQERFTLVNEGWVPGLWVTVLDHSTLPGYRVSKVRTIGRRALIHWFTSGRCQRRGLFVLGPTSVETGDPFGFYRVTITYPGISTMMVMPPVVNLPLIDIAASSRAGDGRRFGESLPERSVHAAGVREYSHSDTLSQVHWPTSARRDDLFVRTFDRTPASDWWIFLDIHRATQAGQGQMATEEQAIVLAASLASMGIEGGTAVGLAASGGDNSPVWIPPGLGDHQRWQILRELALLSLGDRPLAHLLSSARGVQKTRSSLIIITADIEGEWLNPLLLLKWRGIIPTVLLLDRPAFGGAGDVDNILGALQEQGIAHHLISPTMLDQQELIPGQIGKWRRTHRGHWEPKFDHDALEWKVLT